MEQVQTEKVVDSDEAPKVEPSRAALVKKWQEKIKKAKEDDKIKIAFERMKKCMKIAAQGTQDDSWAKADKYVLPIINRHINLSVSTLYARNPTTLVKRKERMLFTLWDGKMESAAAALEAASSGDPSQLPVLQDIMQGQQYMMLLDKIARTLQLAWAYYLDEQEHDYKAQLKLAVRRAKTNGVAYVKVGYQRIMERSPDVAARIEDITSKISHIEQLMKESAEPDFDPESSEAEELRLNLADLEQEPDLLVREGPVLSFPRSTAIIVDPACIQLRTLAGANWYAEQMDMCPEDVEEQYGVDIGKNYTKYSTRDIKDEVRDKNSENGNVRVYEVYDRKARQIFTIADGYPDFLESPHSPKVKTERFYPLFPLVFNEVESEDEIFPPSDVWLTRHSQDEINRAREGVRVHRKANKPWYAASNGAIDEKDKDKIGNHVEHEVVFFQNLGPDGDINKVVRKFDHAAIDPAQYDVEGHMQDIMRVVGTQEANFGPTSGATATESSIAENSRQSGQSDNVDDLDELLTAISKYGGQLLLSEASKETIIEIVGPGAAWPDAPQSREEIAKDLSLDIEAGSSGKPNRTAELADMERAAPTILQLPGINPEPFAKKYLGLLDVDLEEGYIEGLPSINAINAAMSKAQGGPAAAGDPNTDPAAQGAEGANNAPAAPGAEQGSQPAFPAPGAGTEPMANQI